MTGPGTAATALSLIIAIWLARRLWRGPLGRWRSRRATRKAARRARRRNFERDFHHKWGMDLTGLLGSSADVDHEASERLWRELDHLEQPPPDTTHPATPLPRHGAGAVAYFNHNLHNHPFPPPRGYRCPADNCNWPRR